MKKLIVIHNIFPVYIKGFWDKLLYSKDFDVDFYFSNKTYQGIKAINPISSYRRPLLEKFHFTHNFYLKKYLIWQTSVVSTCLFKEFDTAIFLGEATIISTWVGSIIARLRGKKVIFRGHGLYGNEKSIKLLARKLFYSIPNEHLIYSEGSKNYMIKNGFSNENIHVIYNSLQYDLQKKIFDELVNGSIKKTWKYFKNKNPILFFMGRLTKEKKIDLLIDAVSNLNKEKPKYNLLVIGDGDEYSFLRKKSLKLIENGTCHFTGKVFDEFQLANYIYFSDLCVSPGNIGLTAIHSLTYGTPIATHNNNLNQGPEFEIIHDSVNGFFFKENDCQSLEKKIQKWFQKDNNNIKKESLREIIDLKYNPNYQFKLLKRII